ncbi:phytoene synthase [Bradyrhizobium sp. CCBAU 11434]|uniref:Squalene/phytoene synthase family protein n=1 Tax=Bradyrhizobium zhengyangense TaxID=2911009 RepID=A0ABS9LEU2_9BRAD|nr:MULTISPECIES: phytoene/squalene synthase family protein [Bradyrhizobium]MCG2640233.1 squalene/phytoene synthase family protein [Bradyrhizobium zhengyangense]MCG2665515.1 squalene/phytoene synthase family protein [Bradyrhizobium zhengyangense]MDA9523213.1 phytoene synthase [Bradyrhizobium sp. CCBAU 11434]
MSSAATPPDTVTYCADLVRSHDFPHYVATLFAPAAARRAMLALYAFNVEIVRVRDQVSQPLPGEIRFQWWTDLFSGLAHGSAEGNPVAAELLRAIRDFDLPVEPLSLLVDEHQFDLYNDPMPTMTALEGYLAATSSALFALAARIMGDTSDAAEHVARHAGLAQGIAHVIANLPRDASHRQLFLPQQLLAGHGCAMEDVFSGKATPNLHAALNQLIGDARQHLATASSLLAQLPPSARAAFLPLSQAQADLDRLARPGRNPFAPQPVSRLRTLWTLWRASRSREFTK